MDGRDKIVGCIWYARDFQMLPKKKLIKSTFTVLCPDHHVSVKTYSHNYDNGPERARASWVCWARGANAATTKIM